MRPEEIVNRMLEKYATCKSYEDSGYLENFTEGEDRSQAILVKFRTLYKVPFFFRFEWLERPFPTSQWNESVLGCDGEVAFTSWHKDGYKVRPTLKHAIAEMNMISYNSVAQISQHFPDLDLLPVAFFDRHKELMMIGKEDANGTECYCIGSTLKHPHDKFMWISCEDFSIRRVKTYQFADRNFISDLIAEIKKTSGPDADVSHLEGDLAAPKRVYTEKHYEDVAFGKEIPDESFAPPQA